MIVVRDDAGRELQLAAPPGRIASLVPSLTETLFALGCGPSIVAATRFCTEPADGLERVVRVGGTKHVALAPLLETRPDLILMDVDENRKEDFESLAGAGCRIFVADARTVRDVAELVTRLGRLTGTERVASEVAESLRRAILEARARRVRPRRVFCPIWRDPWMSFNDGTYPGDLLRLAGGENVFAGRQPRYCTLGLADVRAAQPEVVLLPDEPYPFQERDLEALAPILAGTPAWRERRVHFIDGRALTWFGVRTEGGLRELTRLLARGS